ncbi:MAG: hypothetical protein J7518_04705 [Nocardioidaceae bacterium]|nr:hypothetical protein [Nocardioidaceae bacterium]
MTIERATTTEQAPPPTSPRPSLRLVPPHEHAWSLRDTEYADGICVRRYECDCGEVDFA